MMETALWIWPFSYMPFTGIGSRVTEDAIWPKEMIRPMTINGVTVSVTACCSELSKGSSGNQPSGIGTMCMKCLML